MFLQFALLRFELGHDRILLLALLVKFIHFFRLHDQYLTFLFLAHLLLFLPCRDQLLMIFNVSDLLFTVGTIATQVIHPLEGIVEIAGRENEIDVIVIAAITIGVDHAAGVLNLERVELLIESIDL